MAWIRVLGAMSGPVKGCLLDEWGPDIDYLDAVGDMGCLSESFAYPGESPGDSGDDDEGD
jgi:hypothetical protein